MQRASGPAFRLGVLTALWRRPAVSEAVLAHYAALRVPGVSLALVAVRSPEDPEPAAPVPGWLYPYAPNAPLSDKWNVGAGALRGRADAVMVVGSDDLVSAAYVARAVGAVRHGADLVRSREWVYYDTATGRACRARPARPGAARVLSAPALERLGWKPWPPGLDRRLDAGMDRALYRALRRGDASRAVREATVEPAPGIALVDVKSDVSMWGYDDVTRYRVADLGADDLAALFSEHFPHALNLLSPMATPKKTTAKKTAAKTAAAKTAPRRTPGVMTNPPSDPPERGGTVKVEGTFDVGAALAAPSARAAGGKPVRLRALNNVPAGYIGEDSKRVWRGAEFSAPPDVARRAVADGLAEEV